MTTAGLFQVSYGLVEGRIKIAAQGGVVSTFWGLRTDVDRLPWPYSGEIDPEEVRGVAPDVHVQAFHMPCGRKDCPIVWEHHLSGSLAAGYHTFAYEHAPGAVVYFRDGRQTASLTSADVAQGSWVFDRPFYLILNLIVGSGWSGRPSMAGPWPVTMSVDWVRVFG
jgi:beta-glucanase (GH16 family)